MERPGNVDLVPFLFGVTGREWLPGPALVRMCTDAGLPAATARTTISRLRDRGGLHAERQGRHLNYRLAGATAAAFTRLEGAHPPADDWDHVFHGILYTVPEKERAFRDALRRSAVLTGYGHLRAGLLIAPRDAWETVSAQMPPVPAGARVAPLRLQLAPDDARAAAAEAWDLDAIAAALDAQRRRLDDAFAAADGPPEPSAESLRAYLDLVRPVFRALLWEPSLPVALLPPTWPRQALLASLHRALAHHQPAARRYTDTLLEQ